MNDVWVWGCREGYICWLTVFGLRWIERSDEWNKRRGVSSVLFHYPVTMSN